MRTDVILINFGEPEEPTLKELIPYLERIFRANATLEPGVSEEARRARSRELAERRAPELLEEYREIGGSPLNRQVREQAAGLERELASRGHPARVRIAMQFTEPFIAEAVRGSRAEGAAAVVGLPLYPLCGASTTVAALEELARAGRAEGIVVHEVSGWHAHPAYVALRAEAVRRTLDKTGLRLDATGTLLWFSAHGTPLRYVEDGPRYVGYVEESCRQVARAVGADRWVIGYQNHANRRIPWTEPANETLLERVEAERVVVVPISFMHEQSETLAELDGELREKVEARGVAFHRVPVPHDDPRFATMLADLVAPFLTGEDPAAAGLVPCRCRAGAGTVCLNGNREV